MNFCRFLTVGSKFFDSISNKCFAFFSSSVTRLATADMMLFLFSVFPSISLRQLLVRGYTNIMKWEDTNTRCFQGCLTGSKLMIHDLKKPKTQHTNILTGDFSWASFVLLCPLCCLLFALHKLQHPSNTPFSIEFEHTQITNTHRFANNGKCTSLCSILTYFRDLKWIWLLGSNLK